MVTKWSDLTIEKWQKILAVNSIGFDWYEKEIEVLAILCDTDSATLKTKTIGEIADMKKAMEFLNEAPPSKLLTSTIIEGNSFDIDFKVQTKTAAQLVDALTFTKDKEKMAANETLHNLLAIFVIPKGEKYDGSKAIDRAEYLRKHLTMDIAHPLAVFFYKVYTVSVMDIQQSLEKNNNKMMKALLNQLERKAAMKKFTAGLSRLTPFRKATGLKKMK